jgi:hypothetical protein
MNRNIWSQHVAQQALLTFGPSSERTVITLPHQEQFDRDRGLRFAPRLQLYTVLSL